MHARFERFDVVGETVCEEREREPRIVVASLRLQCVDPRAPGVGFVGLRGER